MLYIEPGREIKASPIPNQKDPLVAAESVSEKEDIRSSEWKLVVKEREWDDGTEMGTENVRNQETVQ